MRPARRRSLLPLATLASLAAIVAAGCLPTAVTRQGRAASDLWTVFLVPAIVVAAIVWGLTTFAIIRYRRRATTSDALPEQISGNTRLEIVWTVIPIAIVVVLFWLTLGALAQFDEKSDGGIDVEISAFRWQWRIDYPADGVVIVGLPEAPPEMVVPIDEPVHVTLTSPDVVHSFYVPAFLFKRDAVPGRPTEFEFTVEEPGAYGGQCAEFCGVFHARMTLTVRAVPRPEYEAWLVARQADAEAAAGAAGTAP